MTDTKREAPASPEKRAAALEIVLRRKADMPKHFVPLPSPLPSGSAPEPTLPLGPRSPETPKRPET